MRSLRALIAPFLLAAVLPFSAAADPVAVAFLGTANSGGDPRYDYLEPLISSLVLYDLSSADGLALSDRGMLEAVLREQELSLNLGKGEAAKLGGVLGADWVLKAEYAVLGQDVSVSLTLVDAETAQAFVYADRGNDENLVHGLAEKAVKKLSGADASFRSEQRQRSLLSLKDVKPGGVSLHCALIDAQILVDGEFAAYTRGNVRDPIKLEGLDPGKHVIRIRLPGFGMVKLPQVEYVDWEKTVEILPGKNLVVKADAALFSELYYQLSRLADERFKLLPQAGRDSFEVKKEYPFTDRQGRSRPIALSFKATRGEAGGRISGELTLGGTAAPFSLDCAPGKEAETQAVNGPIKVFAEIDLKSDIRNDFRVSLERIDVEFGEWNGK